MKASQITQEQAMIDIFTQELDQIYYPGYSEEADSEIYNWELQEFKGQFSGKY